MSDTSQCPRCQARGKPDYFGSNPRCAFVAGVFTSDNWQCATMNELRDLAEREDIGRNMRWNDGSIGFVAMDFGFIVMTWYKNRGATGNALWVSDDDPGHPLTLAEADEAIAYAQAVALPSPESSDA